LLIGASRPNTFFMTAAMVSFMDLAIQTFF
jgi:hypothetical protein